MMKSRKRKKEKGKQRRSFICLALEPLPYLRSQAVAFRG